MLTLYGFGRVNSKVVGLTRDLRVLWTLEELGVPYRVHGVDHPAGETRSEEYRRRCQTIREAHRPIRVL
jgi:glutathione S-transferase